MAGGRFDGNVDYWSPEQDKASGQFGKNLVADGANNKYIIGANQIVRIIPVANMNIKFSDNPAEAIADATNILLIADQEYFISSGERKFMIASASTANVIKVLQKGSVVRNAKLA